MPELPEVETIARTLAKSLPGRVIRRIELSRSDVVHGHPAPLCALLHNRRVDRIDRMGKQIHIQLYDQIVLVVHLGMSGRLTLEPVKQAPALHTHLRIGFDKTRAELRFCDPRRFGGIWLLDQKGGAGNGFGRALPKTGADALDLPREQLADILTRRRQIKALLLDQQPISGLGNIYCDEVLHRAKIHPQTVAADITSPKVRRLHTAIRQILTAAIRAGGSSISDYRKADGTPGSFQNSHRVYGRAGAPCRECSTPIHPLTVAARSTFFCPNCHPAPN